MPVLVAHAAYGTALVDLVTERERDTVASRLSEAIVLLDDLSNVGCLSHTLQAVALYHAQQGDLERAARTAASASGLRDRLAMVFAPYCGFWPDVDLTALDPDLQASAFDTGHSFSYEEAVQHALEGLAAGSAQ
jgi:hypothetical protein